MLCRLSPTKGVKGDPRRLQCMSIFPSPHPLSSRKLKKASKLPSHRYLPTPTTFHFLPPPYIFAPISPSSLLFQAISPSSLLCTSPLYSRFNFLTIFDSTTAIAATSISSEIPILAHKLCGKHPSTTPSFKGFEA